MTAGLGRPGAQAATQADPPTSSVAVEDRPANPAGTGGDNGPEAAGEPVAEGEALEEQLGWVGVGARGQRSRT